MLVIDNVHSDPNKHNPGVGARNTTYSEGYNI